MAPPTLQDAPLRIPMVHCVTVDTLAYAASKATKAEPTKWVNVAAVKRQMIEAAGLGIEAHPRYVVAEWFGARGSARIVKVITAGNDVAEANRRAAAAAACYGADCIPMEVHDPATCRHPGCIDRLPWGAW